MITAQTTSDGIPVYCAFDEFAAIDTLVGNPRNPNTHPERQIELLAKIIETQGWRVPITVSNRSGFVVRGHGRLAAARLMGATVVPIDRQDYGDEAAEWADLIADNRIAELADMDMAILKDLLESIDDGSFDMDLTGFDQAALEDVLTAAFDETNVIEDTPPEPQAIAITVPGEVWILGRHRLRCGDSTKAEDVQALLAGKEADAVWTDPPYNVDYVGGTGLTIANDHQTAGAFYSFLVDAFRASLQVSKPGAAIYVCHADTEGINFRPAITEAGWELKQVLIWVKQQFVLSRQDYNWQHEPILYGWKPGAAHHWYGPFNKTTVLDDELDLGTLKKAELVAMLTEIKNSSSVIREDRPKRSAEHPTMKPVRLIARMLVNSTTRGDIVLDPFGGSGSTLIAAEQLGRTCYTQELDPIYCDVIVARWENLTGAKAMRADDVGQIGQL